MRFANAPVSYGVYGDITVEGATTTRELLATMGQAGYEGSELGPPGFFGPAAEAAAAFRDADLAAVGAYVPLTTQASDDVIARDLDGLRRTIDEIAVVDPRALVILADEGDATLRSRPRKDAAQSLGAEGWARLVATVGRAAAEARDRGLEVSFHPHIATYVELPDEIDRLLEDTDVALTFDVGHVVLAGGDPVELFGRWRDRIDHVHLKDVRPAVFEAGRASGAPDYDSWWPEVAAPFGQGDSDLAGFAAVLRASGYDRWVVVEQDRAPLTAAEYPGVIADQAANLEWLRAHLGGDRTP